NWTGGGLDGSGSVVVASGATLSIAGGNDKAFSQRTLANSGTVIWSGGNFNTGNGAILTNLVGGVIDIQSDQSWTHNQGGSPAAINNAGLLKKSAGSGTSTVQAVLNNYGTLDIQSGTLSFSKSGDGHGIYKVAAGATLNFGSDGTTLEADSSVSGAGTVSFGGSTVNGHGSYTVTGNTAISGGVASFNGNASTLNVSLSGGTLSGSGVLTVSGVMNWTGGGLDGSGSVVVASGATLSIAGGNDKAFSQRTLA